MYSEVSAVIQSAKTAYELVKATHGLANSNEVLIAMNDVQMKLSGAIASALASQEREAALAARVRELETQLRDSEDWKTQMQSYELFEFPTKTFAYKLKPELAKATPLHYLCAACANKKKKTMLQPNYVYLECPDCKSTIQVQSPPLRSQRRSQISGGISWMS